MRIRTIKPEWLSSESLASLSDRARVMSVALILLADNFGRGRGSVAELAAQVWRFEMAEDGGRKAPEVFMKAHEAFSELQKAGFVRPYMVGKSAFYELPGWDRHQYVPHKGKPVIPPPCDDSGDLHEGFMKPSDKVSQDQGSGIRDQGEGRDRETAAEWTRPKGLTAIGETIRQAVVEHHEARRLPPPSETRSLTHPRWTEIAAWLVDAARLRKWDDDIHQRARALVAAFYASTDPRTVQAKHAIAYLAKNPAQYVGLEAA